MLRKLICLAIMSRKMVFLLSLLYIILQNVNIISRYFIDLLKFQNGYTNIVNEWASTNIDQRRCYEVHFENGFHCKLLIFRPASSKH